MFNLQGSEIIIILLLALVVLGPEKLPDAMRKMGQFYAELRKMSSGFQEEFRAAVDEPLREIRDTANTLRDSADFTKLQEGTRAEKPKSAEMADAGDPSPAPVDDVPTFESPGGAAEDAPVATEDSAAAPFDDGAETPRRRIPTEPAPVPDPPAPFTGMSSVTPAADADPAPDIDPDDDHDAAEVGAADTAPGPVDAPDEAGSTPADEPSRPTP